MECLRKFWVVLVALLLTADVVPACAQEQEAGGSGSDVDMRGIIFGHILDSYQWHITTWGDTEITIPLPVIVHSSTGWHVFSSARLEENGGSYEGLSMAAEGSPYEGHLVEHDAQGNEVRPFDLSITKDVLSLFMSSVLLLVVVLGVAHWYKHHQVTDKAPGGFTGFMEMFIMAINDGVIKESIGPNWRKFSPYLLTAFFFIFLNNVMGLIPIFPGGANLTGNIAITFFLALCSFFAINLFGTKRYWKDIFWPDVPWWLKMPIPIMPVIEIFSMFTKPMSLMIRLFANVMSGHMSILVLTCLVFLTAKMGAVINGSSTVIAVLFSIFMNALEVLVGFIQAYVFTMLSAVFIGLAQEGGEEKHEGEATVSRNALEEKQRI